MSSGPSTSLHQRPNTLSMQPLMRLVHGPEFCAISVQLISSPILRQNLMKFMEIKLDLSRHCIETEIKKMHDRAIYLYFKCDKEHGFKTEQEKQTLENRIELLEQALKIFDFGFLRKNFVTLAGNNNDDVVLSRENNQFMIRINGIRQYQHAIHAI